MKDAVGEEESQMSVVSGNDFFLLENWSSQREGNYFVMISDTCRLLTWKQSSSPTCVSSRDFSMSPRSIGVGVSERA